MRAAAIWHIACVVYWSQRNIIMKTKASLFLTVIALLMVTRASAAQNRLDEETLVLPTYTVRAPRQLSFEKEMKEDLEKLSQQARTPMAVGTQAPALQIRVHPHQLALYVRATEAKPRVKS